MRSALFSALLATILTGCGSRAPDPEQAPEAATAAAAKPLSGPVLERLEAPPYVYLRIKASSGEVWAAVPEANVETGATVTVYSPMLMSKFQSPSLGRTFDAVYFGTLTPPSATASSHAANPHANVPRSTPSVEIGTIARATGADARTVAEAWAQRASLVGKTVTIRGVVVKYNAGVMGKNWIHLQDGSGDPTQGTNDLTVTSGDEAAKGDTVTITGTVATDKDFGAGYTYPIIVENARVSKQ